MGALVAMRSGQGAMSKEPGSPLVGRRFVLAGLLASAAAPALADPLRSSPRPAPRPAAVSVRAAKSLADQIRAAGLPGQVSCVVHDAETGEMLESHLPDLALPPASVAKSVTALYALSALGPGHRFRTRLIATGPVIDGRLKGDLHLVGGGDPTLDTDALADLARQLKEAGLREISGKAWVNASALPYQKSIDPEQPAHLGYSPALSGLNLNFNRVFFQWKRQREGYEITMDARALKYRPRVETSRIRVVDRKSPIFTYSAGAQGESWTVAKRALGRHGGRWLPVRRPDLYAGEVFRILARSFGIQLPEFRVASRVPAGMVLARWQSDPLEEVLRGMMKHSTNLTAEAVGVSASIARGARPATLRASARRMTDWLQETMAVSGARFADHSGLGEGSRMSAAGMGRILLAEGWDGTLHGLMKEVDLVDGKGRPVKDSPVDLRAKTGTLNFVSALAGYARGPNGRKLAFAIFIADGKRRRSITKAEKERPKGARGWNRKAKTLQQDLVLRWTGAVLG